MNGFSTGEEDSRGAADQICCLLDEGERCTRPAGNASYSKRIQKTVTQRRLKLNLDQVVRLMDMKNSIKNIIRLILFSIEIQTPSLLTRCMFVCYCLYRVQ